ncbi:hypothetical protein DBR43_17480 [Pedobacter sp. KBW06]|uniref:lanthionine synthetase LanC family protein n=1 Tax=Pedobacter sp. KBW06 TaxID=2153359 RepID=UPI000F5A12BF|nr:lanthionine synthetase LanC family protein [Pedobacter sp. KBW06]RQO69845.1 hypothetical protein DBR43_17480 [Pedobacter sp. KBW06]
MGSQTTSVSPQVAIPEEFFYLIKTEIMEYEMIKSFDDALLSNRIAESEVEDDSLLGGGMGYSLYHAALAEIRDDEQYPERAFQQIEKTFQRLSAGTSSLDGIAMGTGLTGFAAVISYFCEQGFLDESVKEELTGIEEIMFKGAMLQLEKGHTDFLFGASGPLSYFLDEKANERNTVYINKLIEAMIHYGRKNSTSGLLLPEPNRFFSHINLGIAHGLSGTGLVLAKAAADARVDQQGPVSEMLHHILGYQLQQRTTKGDAIFPIKVDKQSGKPEFSANQSWSYGDLGILLFIYTLSNLFDDAQIRNTADLLTEEIMANRFTHEMIPENPGMRHGFSGKIMLIGKLAAISGNQKYKTLYKNQYSLFQSMMNNYDLDLGASSLNFEGLVGARLVAQSHLLSVEQLSWKKIFLM